MKKLTLKTAAFRYLENSYGEWLDILGYAPTTVRTFPTYIREFLHYLEQHGYDRIDQIDIALIRNYYYELSRRGNERRGGGLSNNYLNTHLNALDRLLEYLRKKARIVIPQAGIPKETPNPAEVVPLTLEQVKKLYEAADTCAEDRGQLKTTRNDRPAIHLRDKAILAVFYNCGLRRSEGEALNLSDLHYDTRLLEVKKGKGGQPRFVPMSHSTVAHLQNYQYEGRPLQIKCANEDAFFLNHEGKRATGGMLNNRLKVVQRYSDDAALHQKRLHLHLLRHSIATHLLYQGMSLEKQVGGDAVA